MASPNLPNLLRLTLRSGTVYYFQHRELTSGEPHFFIVLNAEPQSDKILILAVGSSQIDTVRRRRAGLPPESLVVVDEPEYPDFSKPTVIDCNQVFELSKEELIQTFNTRGLRHHLDLPKTLLEKVWIGVRASPRVDEIHKRLLPPDSTNR
jgi:hypothetical protein